MQGAYYRMESNLYFDCTILTVANRPNAVSAVSVPSQVSTGQEFQISWTNMSYATKYRVQRRIGNAGWITLGDFTSNSITDIAPLTIPNPATLMYQVQAGNADNYFATAKQSASIQVIDQVHYVFIPDIRYCFIKSLTVPIEPIINSPIHRLHL